MTSELIKYRLVHLYRYNCIVWNLKKKWHRPICKSCNGIQDIVLHWNTISIDWSCIYQMQTYPFISLQKLDGDKQMCCQVYFWRIAPMSGNFFMLYALLNDEPWTSLFKVFFSKVTLDYFWKLVAELGSHIQQWYSQHSCFCLFVYSS